MVLGMVTTAQRVLAGLARVKERGISLGRRPLEDSDAARVDPVGRSRRSLAPASFRRDLTTQPPATIFRTSSAVFGVTETDKLLNRRELCLGALPAVGTITAALSSTSALAAGAVSVSAGRTVKIHDNTIVPALGQGSARLGQGRHPEAAEEEALRTGLSLGMTLIDTAEIYGNGNAERLISHVIAGQRDRVFLVSKVWPSHVAGNGIERACDASLARLATDHLDLYLLHWPSGITEFSGVVTAFENLVSAGKIRAWGVQLQSQPHGTAVPCPPWRSLRDQSDPLQSRRSRDGT